VSLLAPLWAGAATIAAPALRLMLRRRARLGKEIADRLSERRGVERAARPEGDVVWLHAASVGETVSALPVVEALAGLAPRAGILFTTGTVTAARLLQQRLDGGGLAAHVTHRFVPLDVPRWAARFLDHWRPAAAVFLESELWPNILAACRGRRIPLVLLNARLSERSAARWRLVPGFARDVIGTFSLVQAQSAADAARLAALGAVAVSSPGNLKFAAPKLPADPAEVDRLARLLGARPRWLAASTHPGEEAIVLEAHRGLARTYPGLTTLLAPRHPERAAAIAAAMDGVAVIRRSAGDPPADGGIWLIDTLGELGLAYRLADIAFVGRSLVPPGGGQNPLEAARLGCAIAMGPLTGNFNDATAALAEAGALARVADAAGLERWACRMLSDPERREAAARAGAGACDRYADLPLHSARSILAQMRRADV